MKKIIITLIAVVGMFTANAQNTWKVDASHSSVGFSLTHLLISEVTGDFKTFDVTATASDKFEQPSFMATIDAATINTNNGMRDEHLRDADFFDTAKHKNITFKSTSFKQIDDKRFEVMGKMTIKGITKEIRFTGKLNGVVTDPRSKKQKAGLKLTGSINREDFNIGKGMSSISDEVEITIRLEMNKA